MRWAAAQPRALQPLAYGARRKHCAARTAHPTAKPQRSSRQRQSGTRKAGHASGALTAEHTQQSRDAAM
jgi:hypothetical protein